MNQASVALFLSFLVACAPAAAPQKTFFDSYYTSTVNGEAAHYSGRGWIYETPSYRLRYWLGTHEEGSAPGSIKLELSALGPVVVAWDESVYHYANGDTSPITHEGVPYGFRPANSELAAQAVLEDRVVPRNNLVVSGGSVTNAYYLVPRDTFGTTDIGLELVVNGERLDIRMDGSRN